jgi:hypothetical protein
VDEQWGYIGGLTGDVEDDHVYTGTEINGDTASDTCQDWAAQHTSGGGYLPGWTGWSASVDYWSSSSGDDCTRAEHIYCVSNVITDFFDGFERTIRHWAAHEP